MRVVMSKVMRDLMSEVMRDKLDRTTSDEFIEDRKEGGHEVN